MAKLTDANGNEVTVALPEIKGVRPVGTGVLVEIISQKELAGPSKLHLPDSAVTNVTGAPQGYVIEVGSMVDEKFGLKVGSRVVMSGNFVPLPEAKTNNGRMLACVEPYVIKAVLDEA